ncbi:trans-Golgi network-localized SYP41-interacting protein 1 isoform X1 [Lathyrus oleraceus]|uniref:Uncharacterized protein n=1 Tax=Pisum sativum TaxID=3888 RepID=A0A9D4WSS6_PEA|nr:trans-Golgi network-localized SYP41-interacting protein 1 isoform X1 [Pisum sativum]KAI5406210.1 hypothetical protein KIW84_052816 [Pisum sativum]KAI5406211.1 hypothetical protein KIW84_052816 [Pisum sativum]
MSENNHVAEQDSDSDPHLRTQSNGDAESTIDTYQDQQVTHVDLKDEVLEEPEDGISTDTAKEDMFEDCPDELITLDGRIKEEEAVADEHEDEKEEESPILHQQESRFVEFDNGAAGELEQLRIKLENAVAEKESVVEEYQELLSARDREIENLNAKVSELVLSNESLQVSSQAQFEKDGNIDVVVDKMIYSLATVVNRERVSDNSRSGKIFYIEESTALLIEKYNQFLSEIYQLGQSFSEVGLGTIANEYGNILVDARGGLLELKRKEEELVQKLSHLEDENHKLVEELDKEKVIIGTLTTQLGNVKVELEQEKVKCANTKEKLSMAVTKGKALVQQRDSLKASLAGKSSELEKCLIELQEKSASLEAAELTKEELARTENMVASLNNSLQQNHTIFEQVEEILSHAELDQPEMLDLPERLRWLVDDRNKLKGTFLELRKLKDSLSLLDLPESVSSSDLESQMNWFIDSFRKAHNNIYALHEEVSTIKEASINHIDQMSISLLVDSQEKDYLQAELADMRFEYGELVGKNHQISLEKDQIVKMLIDFSGLNMNDEGIDQFSSTTLMIIDLCFQKLKGQSGSLSKASHIDSALFEKIQSLLYVRDQSLMLYEDILEEDFLIRSDVNKLSNELKVVSEEVIALKEERRSLLKDLERSEEIQSLLYVRDQSLTLYEDILEEDLLIRSDVNKLSNELKMVSEEVIALKEERNSLLKDLERSEEKTGMLRDKLSMAVKKGKGLVQDRDNLKGLINEKNSEIEQLKVDLQKHESAVSEYKDEIKRLSSDLESIPKLENDLLEIKKERTRFEQFLMESNNMLQRVMECIDGIVLPVDPVFGEPIEKVKWLAGFVNDCQDAKVHVEQQLQLVKEEASILEVKLAEAQETVNSLEQRLSSSEDTVSQLAEEKTELEREGEKVVEELQSVKEKVAEARSTNKLLEDALSQAEKDISVLSEEKEQAQVSRVAAETELERFRDEAVRQTGELAEASRTIKDLEVELSQVESKVNLLTEKYNADQVVKTDLENELKKLQDEAANDASKSVAAETELERVRAEAVRQTGELAEAIKTIKDLEVELSQVKSKVDILTEKCNADQVVKTDLENELKKLQDEAANDASKSVAAETELERARAEAVRQTGELAEAIKTIKDLEVELSQVESKVDILTEKYNADQVVKTDLENELKKLQDEAANNASKSVAAETELERVRAEAVRQTGELAEAIKTIKDLEVELSQVESKVDILTEKYNADQVVKTDLENELKKLQDEAADNASNSVGSSAPIRSLEDELLKARDDISTLENANEIAKQEISSLSSKLSSYMVDLSGKNGCLGTKSLALLTSFNYLQVLIRDDTLFLKIKQCFERKCETLKKVDLTVNKVNNYLTLAAKDSEGHLEMEEDPPVRKSFTGSLENFEVEMDKGETNGITMETIISSIGKIADELTLRSKHIADAFDEYSDSIDEFLSPLPGKLLETESNIMAIVEHMKIMKEEANSVAKLNEEKDNIIATLENDISLLLSSCTDSTSELQNEVDQNLGQLGSTFEDEKFNHEADEQVEHHRNSKYADASRKLINASGKVQTLIRQFKLKSEQVDTTVRDLQAKLNETTVAFELATEEKDFNKNRVLQLESDIQSLEIACSELKDKVEGYHVLEEKLKEKEEEISSMHSALVAKEEESSILSASQLKDIFDKLDRIDIPIVESGDDLELHTSDPVKKLSYIIDSVTRLHHEINSLSHDKKEMQTILDTKVLEINDLEEEVKQLNRHCEDSKMVKSELFELTSVLEKIIDILGANDDWVVDRKSKGVRELLPALEKHIIAIISESENSKSKAQELGIKLVGSQKVIDELTTKIKLLEDSIQDRNSQPEIVQERSIYEAPLLPASSEITEVEEGSRGKKALSPVPPAAHSRVMRKGSTEHLALDISVESDHLINSTDTDDDKGHVFKSLNTSGFVPKQGKLIADRIDGIWVSGSGVLMSRPRARLGLIGYLLIMHIWLLGTVL